MYHCLIVVHAVHKMNKFTNNKCNKKTKNTIQKCMYKQKAAQIEKVI